MLEVAGPSHIDRIRASEGVRILILLPTLADPADSNPVVVNTVSYEDDIDHMVLEHDLPDVPVALVAVVGIAVADILSLRSTATLVLADGALALLGLAVVALLVLIHLGRVDIKLEELVEDPAEDEDEQGDGEQNG